MSKNNRRTIPVLMSIMLLLIGFATALLMINPYGVTSIQQSFSKAHIVKQPKGKLFQGDIITGEFIADANNLGMVTVGFQRYTKTATEDTIQFRIKEKGSNNWYYTQEIQSGAIEYSSVYPFGFPVIAQSKTKQYIFELESLAGFEMNAIQLNSHDPHMTAVYAFTKSDIFSNAKNFILFMKSKIVLSLSNIHFLLNSSVFVLPLLVYLTRKKSSAKKALIPMAILIGIVVDIYCIQDVHIGLFAFFTLFWSISIKRYAISGMSNYIMALLLFFLWLPFLFFYSIDIQNKLNIWIYFFLVLGTLQTFIDEWRARKI